MAVDILDALIDKQDTFEIVELKIAEILVAEIANQMALAAIALKDPALWDLRIFSERTNPWEQFVNDQDDQVPLVNIWYDNGNFNRSKSDDVERQLHESTFNIDIVGFGIAKDDGGTGHIPGDLAAADNVHRAYRLVRNILMADINNKLQLPGIVWSRWPQSVTEFQPEINKESAQKVVAMRIAFKADFNEFSPQQTPEILEQVSVDVKRTEDGQIVLEADYVYPL